MSAWIIVLIVFVSLVLIAASFRVMKQYERGVVFRFGRLAGVRQPGLNMIVPFLDRLRKVSLRICGRSVTAPGGDNQDNVMVKVDTGIYFLVIDPVKAVASVEDYGEATIQPQRLVANKA